MKKNAPTRLSKFLSMILRHRPERIGIQLDSAGWANIEELLSAVNQSGTKLTRQTLEEIVANDNKQRYTLSTDGKYIRANQGHSIDIDLGLEPVKPPDLLYHGTAERFLEGIYQNGLQRKRRQFVHLSPDKTTALTVGQRHGTPAILIVSAMQMHIDGHKFYRADNGVWLTKEVPTQYLSSL